MKAKLVLSDVGSNYRRIVDGASVGFIIRDWRLECTKYLLLELGGVCMSVFHYYFFLYSSNSTVLISIPVIVFGIL